MQSIHYSEYKLPVCFLCLYNSSMFRRIYRVQYGIIMIVKKKNGYFVVSKGKKNLGGPYPSRIQALKRLRQVEFFKNK